jgi:hypothetical protein
VGRVGLLGGWSTPSGAYGECVERAQDLGHVPCSVAAAVGELDDDPSVCEGIDVSACIAGRDAQLTPEHLGVEHRLFDQQVGNPVNGRVTAGVPASRMSSTQTGFRRVRRASMTSIGAASGTEAAYPSAATS